MHRIVICEEEPDLTQQYREWVESEWNDVDPFECSAADFVIPFPILAIEGRQLLGGLSFTRHAKPDGGPEGVWINTLFVAPAFRNRGIGRDLVQAAELEATKLNFKELFVYTAIPKLYEKLEWVKVEKTDDATVLKKVLPG